MSNKEISSLMHKTVWLLGDDDHTPSPNFVEEMQKLVFVLHRMSQTCSDLESAMSEPQ